MAALIGDDDRLVVGVVESVLYWPRDFLSPKPHSPATTPGPRNPRRCPSKPEKPDRTSKGHVESRKPILLWRLLDEKLHDWDVPRSLFGLAQGGIWFDSGLGVRLTQGLSIGLESVAGRLRARVRARV